MKFCLELFTEKMIIRKSDHLIFNTLNKKFTESFLEVIGCAFLL